MENKVKQLGKMDADQKLVLVAGLVSILSIAFIFMGTRIWEEYKKGVIGNQKSQMLLTAECLADNLEGVVGEYTRDLHSLWAYSKDKSWEEQIRLWNSYREGHGPVIHDVILQGKEGEWGRGYPQEKIKLADSDSVIDDKTKLIPASIGEDGGYVVLRYEPVPGESVSLVLDSQIYYEQVFSGIQVGTNGYVVIKDKSGTILMHPGQNQYGIDVIEGRHEMYPNKDLTSLKAMIDHQLEGRTGVEEYNSYWWTKEGAPAVRKLSAYTPANIGEDFLVVSVVIDYDDIYIPVETGFFRIILVFICAFITALSIAVYMFRLLLQKKEDKEQIAYLTELNRILEEMHQSEETIAHQQRLQIMGTMTGGIAHEFNNLLTPIMGYADFLMMELPEDSDGFDSAREIYGAAEKAKEIIQQISSLSRKNIETAFKTLDASRVLRRAVKMVQSVCPANIRLTGEMKLDGVFIMGNEPQLNQVILNIGVNAIHAIGREEGGQIRVSARVLRREELEPEVPLGKEESWSRFVQINIEDNGCGMSPDVLKQMFDPFFTTKKGGKGTGLGLALTEQIVTSHRGFVCADSQAGKGTVFHLYFPAVKKDEQETAANAALYHQNDPENRKKKGENAGMSILLVDDNPKVLRLLEKSFARLGVTADAVMSFEEAREKLKNGHYDALAAEQFIKGTSAVNFCMSIQALSPGLILLVMADQVDQELAEARQRGIIHGYVSKPVSDAAILRAVTEAAKGRIITES